MFGSIIFTTRVFQTGYDHAGEHCINLRQLSQPDRRKLVVGRLRILDQLAVHGVDESIELLTYLPLATTQAIAYIEKSKITKLEYFWLYQAASKVPLAFNSIKFLDSN